MMEIYDFRDYKAYLFSNIGKKGSRKGSRKELAEVCQCHTTYISQVLNGSVHFSLEQAHKVNQYLLHDRQQSQFFLLLVQYARAGSHDLKDHIRSEIEKMREERLLLKKVLTDSKGLSQEQQDTYYSAWYYAAIHVAVETSEWNSEDSLAKKLLLNHLTVRKALEFLVAAGLIEESGGFFYTGKVNFHLSDDSINIIRHHRNWRLKAIESLDRFDREDLHYSAVATVSQSDLKKIRKIFVESIEKIVKISSKTKAEKLVALGVDLFEIN